MKNLHISSKTILQRSIAAMIAMSMASTMDAQMIFNGENTLSEDTLAWPEGFHVGYGDGQDGTLNLDFVWVDAHPEISLANSNGSGTKNTAVLNLRQDSRLTTFRPQAGRPDADLLDDAFNIGYDGDGTINLITDGELGATLRTRVARLGKMPEGSGTINVSGAKSVWHMYTWAVDVGAQGSGVVNVTGGGSITGAQRFSIGGTYLGNHGDPEAGPAGGTGFLNVDGEGSSVSWANSTLSYLGIGRRGTGVVTVSNGGLINANDTTESGMRIYVGSQGGDGTLIVESGGQVDTNAVFRVQSNEAARGHVRVDGVGSKINISNAGLSFVGNTGISAVEGGKGTVEIVNGGEIAFAGSLRVGNQVGAVGEILIDGPGSILNLGTYFQIGAEGTGLMQVKNGGRVVIADGTGSFSSIARNQGQGTVIVEGSGSEIIAPLHLHLASDNSFAWTDGQGSLLVRDQGLVEVGQNMNARGASVVQIDGGSVRVGGLASFGDSGSMLTGEGLFEGNISLTGNAAILGTGSGLAVAGIVSGSGTVENATVQGVSVAATTGSLALNSVRFDSTVTPTLEVTLDAANMDGLVVFDEATDFSNVNLTITFVPFAPGRDVSPQVFNYTGTGTANYTFASVNVPQDWIFEEGRLRHVDAGGGSSLFDTWAASHGLSGEDAVSDADPDGDGLTNIAEFTFGTNPVAGTASLVSISAEGGILKIRWNRSTDSSVSYAIESSDALSEWTMIADAAPTVMADPDQPVPSGYERVEWSVNISGDRSFYRVSSDAAGAL